MTINEALAGIEIHVTSLENEARDHPKEFYRGDGPTRVAGLLERFEYFLPRLHKLVRT